LLNNLHNLINFTEHNHAPQAGHLETIKAITEFKRHASEGHEKPV
ncbi:3626_t:CDS:1, partial [Cetraspora pellucida]